MTATTHVYILAGARTPVGAFNGELASQAAAQLGGVAIAGALGRAAVDPSVIDEVYMGCVLTAGQGQAPARQAALKAGLSQATPCTTINKMCASGMQAAMLGYQGITSGMQQIMVCGGMESMSNAPYLLPKVRQGLRMGHAQALDHMFLDGLEDAYEGQLMGAFAQTTADQHQLTREQMDAYAIGSIEKTHQAIASGWLAKEIEPVLVKTKTSSQQMTNDEPPGLARLDKIPHLRPAFASSGTITAANASSIADGAAALVLASEAAVKQHQLAPVARIVGIASHARAPRDFTLAPTDAIAKLLQQLDWSVDGVDLFEINEAFAMVPMLTARALAIPTEKINCYGGACAQGHPIGASGARILVTLINALHNRNLKKGVAGLCIGGGEGTAVAVEML